MVGGMLALPPAISFAASDPSRPLLNQPPKKAIRPFVYSIEFTNPPCLLPRTKIGEANVIKRLAKADAILLGEHARSEEDKKLAVQICSRIIKDTKRKLVIGLECIEQPFQSVLDEYLKSSLSQEDSDAKLFQDSQWSSRWKFPFEPYLPLFHFAKANGISLRALGLPSEITSRVNSDGLEALSENEKKSYILNSENFVNYVTLPGFKRYTDRVILPKYAFYAANKLLGESPSEEKFFSSRLIQDEAISTKIAKSLVENSSSEETFVALLSNDRVKFGYGVLERLKYQLAYLKNLPPPSNEEVLANPSQRLVASIGNQRDVLSVMLNPTAPDSTSQTTQLTLSLAYGVNLPESRPLADYIWFSEIPQLKLLTRPKNPINNEGDKPPGESSIIKAF